MNLYIMRHGETEYNKKGLIQGTTDIPLNDYGIQLAEETRDGFVKDGIIFQKIIASPLIRAVKTAEVIGEKTLSVPFQEAVQKGAFQLDDRIREFGFGKYEGCKLKELKLIDPNIVSCFSDPDSYEPDPTAESYEQLLIRLQEFLKEAIYPLEQQTEIENLLVVCHGTVIRGLISLIRGVTMKDFWKISQPNCCVNLFELRDHQLKSVRENILYYESEDLIYRGIL